MIEYHVGHEPDFWEPNPGLTSHRFALGRSAGSAGAPLVAIGMNPSHAAEGQADKTVNRMIKASVHHGYSGRIMLNFYPERPPKPSQLTGFDPALYAQSCAAIEQVFVEHGVTEVLGAWGIHASSNSQTSVGRRASSAQPYGCPGLNLGSAD